MKTQEQLETLNGQAYPSSYGYTYPKNSPIRPCVVFDGGNRFIKWIDPENNVKIIPSCIKEVSEYQWKRLRPDPETVLLEVDGKRYAVGKLVQDLGGEPTFQRDKCELAEILALVAIEPNPGFTNVHIVKLVIALPNSLNDEDVAAEKRLENYPLTKEFKRNSQHIRHLRKCSKAFVDRLFAGQMPSTFLNPFNDFIRITDSFRAKTEKMLTIFPQILTPPS